MLNGQVGRSTGAGEHMPVRVGPRLGRRDLTGHEFALGDGLIGGHLDEAVAENVEATVPTVGYPHPAVLGEFGKRQGGRHVCVVAAGLAEYGPLGGAQPIYDRHETAHGRSGSRFHRQPAGHLPCVEPTEAVGNHEDERPRTRAGALWIERIFVVFTGPPGMGVTRPGVYERHLCSPVTILSHPGTVRSPRPGFE